MFASSEYYSLMIIDLNADVGECAATDADLLSVITSANIACGAHAGDDALIRRTVRLAIAHGVGIGAHPSFPDREGFGRRVLAMSPVDVTRTVEAQINVLVAAARDAGARLQHIKPHGALYHLAASDPTYAAAIGETVRRVDPGLIVVALAGSAMVQVLRTMGLRVAREAFIDRGYTASGTLIPRDQMGVLVTDVDDAAARAVRLVQERVVRSIRGIDVRVEADTLCVHGDTPNAVGLAQAARRALEGAGVTVQSMAAFL